MGGLLILALLLDGTGTTDLFGQENNFSLHENSATLLYPDAEVRESGELTAVTYTKRSRCQITPCNISTTYTSGITDVSSLVRYTLLNGDASHWDVSNTTNTRLMITNSGFNQPIGDWGESSVTTKRSVFGGSNSNKPITHLELFDMLDHLVAVLENGTRNAGMHEVIFDASGLSNGMYIYPNPSIGLYGDAEDDVDEVGFISNQLPTDS